MSTEKQTFCTFCDPSPVLATAWCAECNDFLCSECKQHHKKSKTSKNHSISGLEEYNKLPQIIKNLKFICEDHEERFDSFCSVHSSPCCVRCLLTSHMSCRDVTPLADLVSIAKTSPAMIDLESSITDLSSYIEKLTFEMETHKADITKQEEKIRNEIKEQRNVLNDHLDRLEKNLIESLHTTFSAKLNEIEEILISVKDIGEKINRISSDLVKIKTHASDIQSFFSLLCLQSMVATEEKCIEQLQNDKKLVKKDLEFVVKTGAVLSVDSYGNIAIKESTYSTQIVRQKEKEAQLVDTISNVPDKDVALQLINSVFLTLVSLNEKKVQNIITGCAVTGDGNIFIAENNSKEYCDRVSLHDYTGKFIKCIKNFSEETLYNLTHLRNTSQSILAFTTNWQSENSSKTRWNIHLLATESSNKIRSFEVGNSIYGVTGCEENVFYTSNEGIGKYNTNHGSNDLIFKQECNQFSYIFYYEKNLYFTHGEGSSSVSCCDETGNLLWTFENTQVLREASGVVVDKSGHVFVAGNKSNNVICITQGGNQAKEILKITSPLTLCYDENEHRLFVCNESNVAYIYQVCDE